MNAAESQRIGTGGLDLYSRLLGRIENTLQTLPDKPEETSDSTLRCLWHLASGTPLSPDAAIEEPLTSLTPDMQASLERLVEQRVSGVPLAHLSGRQRFMGLELLASAQALIPRRETELLAGAAIDTLLNRVLAERGQATVIDACTGCGNLAVAMAHADRRVQMFASDLSAEAVELAQRNVDHLGLGARVELRVGDLLQPFDEPFLADMLLTDRVKSTKEVLDRAAFPGDRLKIKEKSHRPVIGRRVAPLDCGLDLTPDAFTSPCY